jgi:hypothetical protein
MFPARDHVVVVVVVVFASILKEKEGLLNCMGVGKNWTDTVDLAPIFSLDRSTFLRVLSSLAKALLTAPLLWLPPPAVSSLLLHKLSASVASPYTPPPWWCVL